MSEQNSVIPETEDRRNLLVLLFAGFVLSGIARRSDAAHFYQEMVSR